MADTKVSELTAATSIGGSDRFYLVQSGTSKSVTAAVLFDNIANPSITGNVVYDAYETLTTAGIVDLTKPVTRLSAASTNYNITLPNGQNGQIKFLLMTENTGGATYTLQGNIANNATVEFNAAGHTATMMYQGSGWYVVGGTATVS